MFGLLRRTRQNRSGWRLDPGHRRGPKVAVLVDGVRVDAYAGECLAVALAVSGRPTLRHSPEAGTPRGLFCLMGSCQEYLVHVDGTPVVACMEPVRPGMRVTLDRLAHERSAASASDRTGH